MPRDGGSEERRASAGDLIPRDAPRTFEPTPLGVGQRAFKTLVHGVAGSWIKLEVENLPDLGRNSPVILAPNHTSYLDPPLLQMTTPYHITFLMTEVIYSRPLVRAFFRFWQTIPVPENGSSAGAIKAALRAMRDRRPVCIFPEGRISDDGYLNEGRGGVVTLMARAQVPVIPVAILGPYRMLPRGRLIPRPGRVVIRYGDPIAPPSRASRDEVGAYAGRIMDAIHALGAPRHGEDLGLARYRYWGA